jgi:hypothetical protein
MPTMGYQRAYEHASVYCEFFNRDCGRIKNVLNKRKEDLPLLDHCEVRGDKVLLLSTRLAIQHEYPKVMAALRKKCEDVVATDVVFKRDPWTPNDPFADYGQFIVIGRRVISCRCSALHTSLDCPKHGRQAAKAIWRDVEWRCVTEPLLLMDRPRRVASLDPAVPGGDMTVREFVEVMPGSGLCLPAEAVNMVQPENSALPIISMVRPFKESAGTRAMIESFKKANPVVPPQFTEEQKRVSSSLKPIIDLDDPPVPGTKVVGAKMIWWCDVHDRQATHPDKRTGEYQCDPKLGGIMMPCRVRSTVRRDRVEIVAEDVFRPNESDEEYFLRRRKDKLGY